MHHLGLQSMRKIPERRTVDAVWGQTHSSGRSASPSAEDLSLPRDARGATKQFRVSEIYVPEETKNSSTKEARKSCPSSSSTGTPASALSCSYRHDKFFCSESCSCAEPTQRRRHARISVLAPRPPRTFAAFSGTFRDAFAAIPVSFVHGLSRTWIAWLNWILQG